ncbi:MAG: VanZ family protein [Clostridia bacterium]|nr:VanZ family protein [Clostridia bacterium]
MIKRFLKERGRLCLTWLCLLLVVGNMAFIFYQSAQSAASSATISGSVTDVVVDVVVPDLSERPLPEQTTITGKIHTLVRTLAHGIEFATLALFLWLLLLAYPKTAPLQDYYKALFVALFCFLYALSDEWHQIYVEGRAFDMKDVAIDMAGVGVSIAVLWCVGILWRFVRQKQSNHKKDHPQEDV